VSATHQLALSDLERDALKELINVSFGDAAASLGEIIGTYVLLSVPNVEVMLPEQIAAYIEHEFADPKELSIVEQYFIGKIKGAAYLVFSHEGGRRLLSLFEGAVPIDTSAYSMDFLEKETLTEIGNIVIGTCVSKLAELLTDTVSYLPPRFLASTSAKGSFSGALFEGESHVILLKTLFEFEERNVSGYLFLVNSYESMQWLKKAIGEFIDGYA
jgi:chemotaxis protein CheC